MIISKCQKCGLKYDDADRSTICPHELIMPIEDLERKKLAITLAEKPLRFHGPDILGSPFVAPLFISSISWNGMVTLRGLENYGEFAPHLFTNA
jgi:hypothetical protein